MKVAPLRFTAHHETSYVKNRGATVEDELRLTPGRLEYGIRRADVPGGVGLLPLPDALDSVDVRTRTLLEMLAYLSKGVRVPDEHACRGLAAQTVGPDGIPFDWTAVTRG